MHASKLFKLQELISDLEVTLKGDPHCMISGVAMIQDSKPGQITFLANPLYKKYLPTTQASAVILAEADAADCPTNVIIARNPYLTYAKIAHAFHPLSTPSAGIHPSVVIGKNSVIDPSVHIAAHCVIGNEVNIAAGVHIGANVVIGDGVCIGENSIIDAQVTLYHQVRIGARAHIASGVVIGSDGFGFANHQGTWQKVPQLGTVIIGNDVAIGANTAIDRGAIGDTIIEEGVKLDNLIQIAHNVRIGAHTIIAGCVGIAGSTTIGKYCMIGGASCIAGHINIADKVMITGMSSVTKSITEAGMYSSGIVGALPNAEFRKLNARVYRLDHLMQRVKKLEAALKTLTEEVEDE